MSSMEINIHLQPLPKQINAVIRIVNVIKQASQFVAMTSQLL